MELAVDLVLAFCLLACALLGWVRGLLAGVGTLVGLAAGGVGALALGPVLADRIGDHPAAVPVYVGVLVLLVVLGALLGGALGRRASRPWESSRWGALGRLAGAALGLGAGALALALLAATAGPVGLPGVAASLERSRVVEVLHDLTPDPLEREVDRLGSRLAQAAVPSIGEVLALQRDVEPPQPLDVADPEIARASASVVRLTGPMMACGRSSSGSGFVVGEDLVATNAHVVAGTDSVVVEVPGGQVADGVVVAFDPEADVALVDADLDAPALPLTAPVDPGANTVVQGYPHGGSLTSRSAQVVGRGPVLLTRSDAQGEAPRLRDVYRLGTTVAPGNSGGPVLTGDGAVTGMVFARDDSTEGAAYAVTSTQVGDAVAALGDARGAVDVGPCD